MEELKERRKPLSKAQKNRYVKMCKELGYSDAVITTMEQVNNIFEAENILKKARG